MGPRAIGELFEELGEVAAGELPLERHGGMLAATLEQLAIEPTGRNPRHYDVTFDDLDECTARLSRCEHYIMVKPYREA